MNKVFAVIGGQVFISQAVVEQAALAISKVVVMDCSNGELKFAEKSVIQADELLLDQIRKAAEEGAQAGYRAALEDLRKGEARTADWQIKIAATPEGMLYAAGIGTGAGAAGPTGPQYSVGNNKDAFPEGEDASVILEWLARMVEAAGQRSGLIKEP